MLGLKLKDEYKHNEYISIEKEIILWPIILTLSTTIVFDNIYTGCIAGLIFLLLTLYLVLEKE